MTNRIGQRFGNYRLLRFLGEGGYATVYLAEHIHLNTRAAIKILSTKLTIQETEQFRHEAYLLAHLSHPNIVRVLDFGMEETEGLPFLVMQYASRGTLRQQYAQGEIVPLATILSYINPIATALQHAHDNRIIHRDVKPENMLIGDQNEILLSDFGIALSAQDSLQQKTLALDGTASYMAPEQCQGKPRPASDQYALGIVVYEWLSGTCPFSGSFVEICSQHIMTPPQPLRGRVPTIAPAVAAVVEKVLEKDPALRFSSIQDFATALTEAAVGSTTWKARVIIPTDKSMEYLWLREEESDRYQNASVPTSTTQQTQGPHTPILQETQGPPTGLPSSTHPPRKRKNLLTAILVLVFILILGGSGILATAVLSNNAQTRTIATATALATTPFISAVNFTTQTPSLSHITLISNDSSFSTDHADLLPNQKVTIGFTLQPHKSNIMLSIRGLVSQNGPNNPGFSPINISCNGQTVVSNYTIPGNGNSPDTTSIQLPNQQLTATNNQLQIQVASNAQTIFWLYNLEVTQSA